jgi:hypothetical protein
MPPSLLVREAAELRRLLGQVLDVLDGGFLLTGEQAQLLVFALADVKDFRTGKTIGCPDCDAAELAGDPTVACGRHKPDMAQGNWYDEIGQQIGDWVEARHGS